MFRRIKNKISDLQHGKRVVIAANRTEKQYLKDLWSYRELFIFLSWRDIIVRYKQTVFGVLWSVLRPLLTMLVFTLIFGKFARMPSNGVPYPILVFTGLLPWLYFTGAFQESSASLLANQNLISKIYFPRIIIPISSVFVPLIDFIISLLILFCVMGFYHVIPARHILLLPFFLLMVFFAAIGLGLFTSAMNVKYRDFRYIVPIVIQFGLYLSPVGFSSVIVPQQWRLLYCLNPMVGIIEGFRWCIVGRQNRLDPVSLLMSIAIIIILTVFGVWYFRRTEKGFADVI